MRKVICWFIVMSFISTCTTKKFRETNIDKDTEVYSCSDPQLIKEDGSIKGKFYANYSVVEKDSIKECVTHYSILGAMGRKRNGYASYFVFSIFTIGLLPAVDLLFTIIQANKNTYCDETSVATGKLSEKRPANGVFKGNMIVVPMDQLDQSREIYIKDNLDNVEFAIDRRDAKYAVELNGEYKSSNLECNVRVQSVLQ